MRYLLAALPLLACSTNSRPPDTVGGEATGCDGVQLLANPTDFAAPGPWPVGARTVMVGALPTEVWYPATVGSDASKTKERYDIRKELSPTEASKISDDDNPWQS